eukprot:6564088-Heterocapsa_arctica.AAC.1
MILDDRFCVVPESVARRDTNFLDKWGRVTSVMQKASIKVSKILRHHDPRIEPFDKGGWFLVDDLIGLDKNNDTCLFPDQRNPHFIYNLMYHNETQRFQLAVLTADAGLGGARRS